MKKIVVAALVLGVIAVAGIRPASADSGTALVKVPFDFIVGDKVLPAGSYRVAADMQDPTLLIVTSTTSNLVGTFAAAGWAANPNPADPHAQVAFKNVDGHMFLWRIALPGSDAREITVTRAEAERTLARLNLMPAQPAGSAK